MSTIPIAFDDNGIIVRDETSKTVTEYYMTPVLMEMMFHTKLPTSSPNEEDYKDMLITTTPVGIKY